MAYTNLGTVTTSAGGAFYQFVSVSTSNLNQSFKPSISGTDTLNGFQWYGKTSGTIDIYLRNSSGTLLGQTTDNEASVGWHTISFGYINGVSSSGTYYIIFRPRSGGNVYLYHDNSHAYSNGEGYQGSSSSLGGTDLNVDFAIKITCYNEYTTPTVSTTAASSIGETSATVGGNVTSDGGATVTERGVIWGTVSGDLPNIVTSGSGTGSFAENITGLTGGTQYFFKAFATNAAGTAYGTEDNFTTTSSIPSVTTSATTSVSFTTATGNGNVTSDHGATVTERGVVVNTAGTPTTSDMKFTSGGGTGVFSESITGLTANTLYYLRAYAINTNGTAYGSQTSFTTLIDVPTVTTSATISNIDTDGADVSGEVVSANGNAITERGFVRGSAANPTIGDAKTVISGTIGVMNYTYTGLLGGTTYHFRAYATNSQGTGYGADRMFTTLPSDPSGLTVTANGKTQIDLAWTKGTNGNYTIIRGQQGSYPANINSGTLIYNGTASSTSHTGLSAGQNWFYRAWASTTSDGLTAVSANYVQAETTTVKDFTNASNALTDSGDYATVPAGDGKLYAQVSKDNGANWSNMIELTFTGAIVTSSFGLGNSELWGGSFVGSDMDDGNLAVKITGGSNYESYQIFKTFGFAITNTAIITGINVQVKATYDSSDILLYFVKVNPQYGTSNLEIGEGSLAYDTDFNTPTFYDGSAWIPIARAADIPTLPVKATGAEVNTGTDDAKFVTPKAVTDSDIVVDAGYFTAWGAHSLAVTGGVSSIGNATVTSKYKQIGKIVFCWAFIQFGNTTSFTTGNMTFSLPVTPVSTSGYEGTIIGNAYLENQGISSHTAQVQLGGSSTCYLVIDNASSTYVSNAVVSDTLPFTFGQNDIIRFSIMYEAA